MAEHPNFSVDDVTLTQIDDGVFHLDKSFTYTAANGDEYTVDKDVLNEHGTDLASVPSIIWWYVGSYGRHTRPALLHDFLVRTWKAERRAQADALFREALRLCKVPPLRRGLMWTAVSLETTFLRIRSKAWARLLIILLSAMLAATAVWVAHRHDPWWLFWSLSVVAGAALILSWNHPGEALLVDQVVLIVGSLVYWLVDGEQWWELAIFASAALTWLLWRRRCGWMIAGILFVLPPSAINWVARAITGVLEYPAFGVVWLWWWLNEKRPTVPGPKPAPELPKGPFKPTRVRPWLSEGQ